MLARRLRRRPNIEPILAGFVCLLGTLLISKGTIMMVIFTCTGMDRAVTEVAAAVMAAGAEVMAAEAMAEAAAAAAVTKEAVAVVTAVVTGITLDMEVVAVTVSSRAEAMDHDREAQVSWRATLRQARTAAGQL